MTITNEQREQVRTRGAVAIPDPYGLLGRYEERLSVLERALGKISSCEKRFNGDVVDIARKALGGETND